MQRIVQVLAIVFALGCENGSRVEPTFVHHCETAEQRAAMADLIRDCAASARWANQVSRCEHVARETVCPSVPGFVQHRPGYPPAHLPCSEAVTEQQRSACAGRHATRLYEGKRAPGRKQPPALPDDESEYDDEWDD